MSDPTDDPELGDPGLGTAGNLAAKLADAMTSIGEIPKNGHNDYHGYDYPLESDVMDALRSELAERGVAIFPSVEGRSVNRVGNEEDGYTLHTRVQLAITLVDSESGEQRTMHWEGEAMDGQDKGLYKAYTSGMKYWALKTFLMSAGDDVERSNPGGGAHQNSRSNGSREPTDPQVEFAQNLAQSSVWSNNEKESLQGRIQNYNRSQMSDLIDQMKSTIEEREAGQNGKQEPSKQAAGAGEANHPEFEDDSDLPF
jgi:hypothetical protein